MHQIVLVLLSLLLSTAAAAGSNPGIPATEQEAGASLARAMAEREARNQEWSKSMQDFLGYRGRKFDPEKWNALKMSPPPWNRAEHERLLKTAHDALRAQERADDAVAAAREALSRARGAAQKGGFPSARPPKLQGRNTPVTKTSPELAKTLPQKTPKLEGPNTKGPRTLPDALPGRFPSTPGGVAPEDFWPIPWKKPPC
jgi:hypothetical protein